MPDYVYHVTRVRDADSIFAEGLKRHEDPPAAKKQRELAAEHDSSPGEFEMSPTEKAEYRFDELIADARRSGGTPDEFPPHQPAVFFWPSENKAVRAEKDTAWGGVVVEVDAGKIPCDCAIAPVRKLNTIFNNYYNAFKNYGHSEPFDRDEQRQLAREWWQTVEWYDGQVRTGHEIWCPCDVPPHAIERIYDPDSGRTVFAPPDHEDQALLREFANGD